MIDTLRSMEMERQIISAIIEDVLSLGYVITVDNGGENFEIERAHEKEAVLENMMSADWDRLWIYRPTETLHEVGWVMLIYGNDGWDVINDYLCNDAMNLILKRAHELAETLQKESTHA